MLTGAHPATRHLPLSTEHAFSKFTVKSFNGEPTRSLKGSDTSTERAFNNLFPRRTKLSHDYLRLSRVFVFEFNLMPEIWNSRRYPVEKD